jgi:hypothetical protein
MRCSIEELQLRCEAAASTSADAIFPNMRHHDHDTILPLHDVTILPGVFCQAAMVTIRIPGPA